jgi:Tol biopolymer transport system component
LQTDRTRRVARLVAGRVLHIAYFGRQADSYDIFSRAPQAGARPELLLKNGARKFPSDWSHDGKYILYSLDGAGTRLGVWGLSVADRRAAPVLDTVYAEAFAVTLPNGKWVAYQSDQSGRNEGVRSSLRRA